jgi:hypothetical protein
MQVGQRNPFRTVTFTGIDFGGQRHTRVVPLLEQGNQLMKGGKLVILQLPGGKVQLNRGDWVSRRQLRGVLNHIRVRDIQIAAAAQLALKGIGLMEQRIQHKEPTRRITEQAAIRRNGAIVRVNKRKHLLRQGV